MVEVEKGTTVLSAGIFFEFRKERKEVVLSFMT
jgi:hypothetical protein